jgi:glycosyltransferase involved in cell wall biosynthesis
MSKAAAVPHDGVAVVIPAHNAATALDQALPAWGAVLSNLNRPSELFVVNDGSTDGTAEVLAKRANTPRLRVLAHDTRRGFGACLRTALAEVTQPLLLYAGVDYPYTPADVRPMLDRIELRDEILGKRPDLISGCRAGQERPPEVKWLSGAWQAFWRVLAGMPTTDAPPWYGWERWWARVWDGWVFGVPLADASSAFKLYRTAFLRRFPIQSDGDFVHTELVAKATFLTSIMDEIPLTPRTDPLPPLGPTGDDRRTVYRDPQFAFSAPAPEPEPPAPAPAPTAPAAAPEPPVPAT